LELDHVERKVINELTVTDDQEIELREVKRRYDAAFTNRFDPVPEGTRFSVRGELRWKYMINMLYTIYTLLMTDVSVRRLTGFAGILAALLGVVLVPLYFTYAGPPPAWNVLTRNLIGLIDVVALLVFLIGLAHLVRRAGAPYDWFASMISGAGLLYVATTLVAISLETGVVLETPNGTVDPTVDGPVAHANMLLHGSIPRLLAAVTLFAAGAAIVRSGILPRWIGRGAYVVAVINLAFVPAMFFGDDAARFYSAVGWGTAATAATLLLCWALAAGITALRRPSLVETADSGVPSATGQPSAKEQVGI
jgi:hypothetical protein